MERARPGKTMNLESIKLGLAMGLLKLVRRSGRALVRPKYAGQSKGIPWPGRTVARARHSSANSGRRP